MYACICTSIFNLLSQFEIKLLLILLLLFPRQLEASVLFHLGYIPGNKKAPPVFYDPLQCLKFSLKSNPFFPTDAGFDLQLYSSVRLLLRLLLRQFLSGTQDQLPYSPILCDQVNNRPFSGSYCSICRHTFTTLPAAHRLRYISVCYNTQQWCYLEQPSNDHR